METERKRRETMYTNSLNDYLEAKARQQILLCKAEHEHAVSKLLRARKQESKRKRSAIPQHE
jgi:hypothetical protein